MIAIGILFAVVWLCMVVSLGYATYRGFVFQIAAAQAGLNPLGFYWYTKKLPAELIVERQKCRKAARVFLILWCVGLLILLAGFLIQSLK